MQANTAQHISSKPSHNGAEQLNSLLIDELTKVNTLITEQLQSEIPLIPELSSHLIEAGGKRVRPLLTLAAAKLSGYEGHHVYPLAAAVEFIHTATLLHDDVVDESELRRGKTSANRLWGNQPTVLVGDFLFSRAFEMMVSADSLEVLGCLSKTARIIAEGEVNQLMTTRDLNTDKKAYFKVIGAKTAQLFASAARVGPILAGLSEAHKNALEAYGYHIGIAFQLVDDVMDYFSTSEQIGKNAGDDFKEGKMSLPVILAYAAGDKTERSFWQSTIADLKQNPEDLPQALAYMHKHNVPEMCHKEVQLHLTKAKQALDLFEDSEIKVAMLGLADYIGTRTS